MDSSQPAIEPDPTSSLSPITPPPMKQVHTKKTLLVGLIVLLLIAAGAVYYVLAKSKTDTTPKSSTSSSTAATTSQSKIEFPAGKDTVYIEQSSDNKTSYKVLKPGSDKLEATNSDSAIAEKESYSISPNKKKIIKNDGKVSVSDTGKTLNFQPISALDNISEPGYSPASVSVWLDDSSGLILSSSKVTKSSDSAQSIPTIYQSFYRYDFASNEVTKLFDHTEVYGSVYVFGSNVSKNEFYWSSVGEGGVIETLVIASLSDGHELYKAATEIPENAQLKYIKGAIYYGDGSSLYAYNTVTHVSDKLIDLSTDADAMNLSDGTKAKSITTALFSNSAIIAGLSSNTLVFSAQKSRGAKLSNGTETVIYELNLETKKLNQLYMAKSNEHFELNVLVATDRGILTDEYTDNINDQSKSARRLLMIYKSQAKVIDNKSTNRYDNAFSY